MNNSSINTGGVRLSLGGVVVGEADSISVRRVDMVRDEVGVMQSTAFTASGTMMIGEGDRGFLSAMAPKFDAVVVYYNFPRKLRSKKKRIRNKWNKKYTTKSYKLTDCELTGYNEFTAQRAEKLPV